MIKANVEPPTERPVIITARDARVIADALRFCQAMSALMLDADLIAVPIGRGELERVLQTLGEQQS